MLMKTKKALLAVRRILAERDETALDISLVGESRRSRVWRVRSNQTVYAFKVYRSLEGTLPPATEADLRRLLAERGAHVPRPYLASEELDFRNFGGAWSLDEFIQGPILTRQNLRRDWARSFGRTLRILHDLDPAELNDTPGLYDAVPSVVTRSFGDDFITKINRIGSNPTSPNAELFRKIRGALEQSQNNKSICHADIHRSQLIISGERAEALTLIDFGDARCCNRNWDLGSVLIKFGRGAFRQFVRGYGQEAVRDPYILPYAWCLAFAHMASNRTSVSRNAARQFLLETKDMSSL